MTTDCPICLCPITSEVWGVVNPCGHPYHRDCWKEVVAANSSRRGSNSGGGNTNAKCAICKGATEGFVPVYVDLVTCDDNSNNDDDDDDDKGGGGKLQHDAEHNGSECDDDDDDASLEELQADWYNVWGELEDRVRCESGNLLDRLYYIQTTIYKRLTGSCSNNISNSKSMIQRQLERMKSKAKKLQSINAELQTSNERLQSANATLHRSSIDAAVAKERTVVKYKKLQSQFNALGQSYEQYETKTELEKQVLQSKVSQLQNEYVKLLSKSNINELHEMESIRVKYTKMSQEVHDLKAKNRKLESDIDQSNSDWKVKYEKEMSRYNALANEMKHLSSHYYQLVGDNDDGDIICTSSLRNTQSRGSTANKTVTSGSSRSSSSATNKHNMLRNDNNGGTKAIVSQRQDVIDAQIRRDSIGQPNPFNLPTKKNVSTAAPTTTSGREKTNNGVMGNFNNNRGRKAMEALDKSTVRKKQHQVHGLKQPHTLLPSDNRHSATTQSNRLSHDGIRYNEERKDSNDTYDNSNDGLQLMIKPRLSKSKRKHGSISSSNSLNNINSTREEHPATAPAATSSSRSVVATSASYSPRKKKGSITTYFNNKKSKPLPPLAERSYPSYQPHIFFKNDFATSFKN